MRDLDDEVFNKEKFYTTRVSLLAKNANPTVPLIFSFEFEDPRQ